MAKEKSSVITELDKQDVIEKPKYTTDEETYLRGLRMKMENARNTREIGREEFDGMPYSVYYDRNERFANTYITPKNNREDTNFQSGTVRQKLFALLSALVNLNLTGDISAFDKEGLRIQMLGDGMEDIIQKTKEIDNDDEKKYLRQYELLKHGTVFVEEIWDARSKKEKKLNGKFTGQVKGMKWSTKIKKAFATPTRNIIPGVNMFLGDMSIYDISDQPFVFTVDIKPYEEVKTIFRNWERWGNVPKKIVQIEATSTAFYNPNWRLFETPENNVEIIRYQDKWNNEFAVLLNGVLMTPVALPLPWGYEEYNIAQQNLEPIHSKFAYGKSLVARIRNKVALLDELLRLAILKTQKSFMPPYVNISGRILSNRVLMPGKITHGIEPNQLVPINDKEAQGLTTAELSMIQELQASIDAETTSPTFSGQQAKGDPTATEIIELQRQAKQVVGLAVFSVAMLEWKLEWLRLKNILAEGHWFHPEDSVVDEVRGMLKDRFRQVSVERMIEGEGQGRRMIIPTKDIPSPTNIRKAEDALTKEQGMPVRLIFLNPKEVESSRVVWQITVKAKEKKTSETSKLLWRAFIQDMTLLSSMGAVPNSEYLAERTAIIWEEDPTKLFAPNPAQPVQPGQEGQPQGGQGGGLSPRVNLPSPAKAAGRELKQGIAAGV